MNDFFLVKAFSLSDKLDRAIISAIREIKQTDAAAANLQISIQKD